MHRRPIGIFHVEHVEKFIFYHSINTFDVDNCVECVDNAAYADEYTAHAPAAQREKWYKMARSDSLWS